MTARKRGTDPRVEALARHRTGHYFDTVPSLRTGALDEAELNMQSIDAADRAAGYMRINAEESGTTRRVIGRVCRRGHYDFTADPEHEDGACSSKWIGTVTVEVDADYWDDPAALIDECEDSLARVIGAWRNE